MTQNISETKYDVIGLSMVKNEADVIEAFVRHNLAYLDMLIVADNDSSDGTREILLALQNEGLPVLIFDDPIFGYFQSQKMTFMYRKITSVLPASHIILLDADEFILAGSRDHFYDALGRLPVGSQGQYFWRTYIPSPQGIVRRDVLREIRHRRKVETPSYPKSVIACDNRINSQIVVDQGNHNVRLENGHMLPCYQLTGVALAHFPVRNAEQIKAKVVNGWFAYLAKNRTQHVPGEGYQWQQLYRKAIDCNGLTAEDVTREALSYAQTATPQTWPDDVTLDPITPQYPELSYFDLGIADAFAKVARSCERLFVPNPRFLFNLKQIPTVHDANGGQQASTAFHGSWHQQNLYLDLPPFRHVAERHRPESVLDLGCGLGGYLKIFSDSGAKRTVGVDGFPAGAAFLNEGPYLQRDLSKPLDLNETFDLVLCTEVIERITPSCEDAVVDNILRHARERVVFSGADAGQPGVGHINCKPIGYWLEKFSARGWEPNLLDTYSMRALASFSWFQRNTVVLVRKGGVDGNAALELIRQAGQKVNWGDQKAAIVTHPFAAMMSK